MTLATVLIPTYNHCLTLRYSVASALGQTIQDLEVFIVGDGVPEGTREIVGQLQRDDRVRFFDNPKGPRHGELHRHAALEQARGEIVCYLSDDDLWLPEHVETMSELLKEVDFAHAPPYGVNADGSLQPGPALSLPQASSRQALRTGQRLLALSCCAHTLDLYRALPFGWRTTPERARSSTVYMWQQVFAQPNCRALSGARPTVITFPSTLRPGWSMEQRATELADWSGRLADPAYRDGTLLLELIRAEISQRAALLTRLQPDSDDIEQLRTDFELRTAWALTLNRELAERNEVIRQLQHDLAERTGWATSLDQELKSRDAAIRQLQRDFAERTAWATSLDRELKSRDAAIRQLQRDFDERTAWALKLDRELTERDATVRRLQHDLEEQTAWALKLDRELQSLEELIQQLRAGRVRASAGPD